MKLTVKIFLSLVFGLINCLLLAGDAPAGAGAGAGCKLKKVVRTRMCATFVVDLWEIEEQVRRLELAELQVAKANQLARIYCCEYKGELAIKMPLGDAVSIFAQTNPRGYAALRAAVMGKGPLRRKVRFLAEQNKKD